MDQRKTIMMRDQRVYDLSLLKLPMLFNRAELKRRFHEASMKHHPDHGGSTKKFQMIREAYERLVKDTPNCLECYDTGRVEIVDGFRKIVEICQCRMRTVDTSNKDVIG